jgi:hypothetical protein
MDTNRDPDGYSDRDPYIVTNSDPNRDPNIYAY